MTDIMKTLQLKKMDATVQKIMTHLDGYNSLELLNIMACITGAIITSLEEKNRHFARATFNDMLDTGLKAPQEIETKPRHHTCRRARSCHYHGRNPVPNNSLGNQPDRRYTGCPL
jgi:hypothetical protein